MTEPQLGTQALQREGGEWNVTATLTNTGQTENCFALADASCLKSEDPPPPIPILEGPQKCSDDLQLTDWHEVTREICKEENLNPLAMPVIFSQQAGGPRTGTPIPSQDMKELQKVIKDSSICSSYFKELLKNTLERTRQTLKRILSQVKRGKAQATPQKRLKKAQPYMKIIVVDIKDFANNFKEGIKIDPTQVLREDKLRTCLDTLMGKMDMAVVNGEKIRTLHDFLYHMPENGVGESYEKVKSRLRMCDRNSPVDTKVSTEGGGGGVAPAARDEIPLQPMVKTMEKKSVFHETLMEVQRSTCRLWRPTPECML
ncbi:hypothetical protein DUI87_16524 [Hirundo rustica rustica]|uniref:Uncharacterized protein n=1 Tax=Hirundo rustica rustica TaxID=333673 RepID=A0A3M0K199_HIRRU|nr:hypothetical protein DUI87_16524 [Hirundo rustica rustica]